MRYLFHAAYKGTQYKGWQWQIDQPSVQECIEKTIQKITGLSVKIHGCGRTDAGVHASQYFFHLNSELEIQDLDHFTFVLNKNLPGDISILGIIKVDDQFNAQRMAISRTYHYFCHLTPDPMLGELSTFINQEVNCERINEGRYLEAA